MNCPFNHTPPSRECRVAAGWGLLTTLILAALVVTGSRNLDHYDDALMGYTFAVLFATFGITYRYGMWLQRPPTAMYWKRGWQVFFRPRQLGVNVIHWWQRFTADFAMNQFIFHRGLRRGLAHLAIMWGCILAVAITFPLVFGWIYFTTAPNDFHIYVVHVFGFQAFEFPIHSLFGYLTFHGLDWASILVILGVMLAMRRRMSDHGIASLQLFSEDFVPLILLFAISVTGLWLTVSYTWMKGYGYSFLATLHAVTVIVTLLYLPFGKFFHIFQRPAQMGVTFYKDAGTEDEPARCGRCNEPYTSRMHRDDLASVQTALGYHYDTYPSICPRCRRALLALAQASTWRVPPGGIAIGAHSSFGNVGLGEGPLGPEDAHNFHP